MALVTPPEWLSSGGRYPAMNDRQVMRDTGLQEGIVDVGHLAVTGGAGFNVNIADGQAWVQGDAVTRQGLYHVVNNGALTNWAPAGGWPAAHATLPRIDQLVVRAYDSSGPVSDNTDVPAFEVVAGTATAGATLANRTGAAALPNTALRIADVLIPNAAVTIISANIGNPKDPRAGTLASIAGAPPQYALGRPWSYVPACRAFRTTDLTVTNDTDTTVTLIDGEQFDTETMHDLAANQQLITIKTPGLWTIGLYAIWAAGVTGYRYAGVIDSAFGTEYVSDRRAATATLGSACALGVPIRLGYGDQIFPRVRHTQGAGLILDRLDMYALWEGP